jgi:hypothetical protein
MFAKPNVVSRDHSLWKATIMRGLKKKTNAINQSVSYSQIFDLFLILLRQEGNYEKY